MSCGRSAVVSSAASTWRCRSVIDSRVLRSEIGSWASVLLLLLGLDYLNGAKTIERAVDEEDLHGDVGLDVRLAEKGEYLAAGERFDGALVAGGHDALEVLPHGDHAVGLAAVHDGLLEWGEAATAHDDDDDVVQRIGLGLHRAGPVVVAQDADDAGRDRRQQMAAGKERR